MANLPTYHEIETFKFADIVRHWARERLVHEVIVSRELACGVVREGLRLQSVDPKWISPDAVLRREPLVGYSVRNGVPIMIRSDALAHLLTVAEGNAEPEPSSLSEEFVTKDDFRKWLVATGHAFPAFWFSDRERGAD